MLRPYRISDTEYHYQAVRESIAELMPWMHWCHDDYSIEESKTWIESREEEWVKGTNYDFVITDARDGLLLGGCGLNYFNPEFRIAELGYWVRTGRTKKGVATAAARLLARFGFGDLTLNRIEIVIAVRIKPACGLPEN